MQAGGGEEEEEEAARWQHTGLKHARCKTQHHVWQVWHPQTDVPTKVQNLRVFQFLLQFAASESWVNQTGRHALAHMVKREVIKW